MHPTEIENQSAHKPSHKNSSSSTMAELLLGETSTTGKLIQEAKKAGVIGHAHSNQKETSGSTLELLLGVETEQKPRRLA